MYYVRYQKPLRLISWNVIWWTALNLGMMPVFSKFSQNLNWLSFSHISVWKCSFFHRCKQLFFPNFFPSFFSNIFYPTSFPQSIFSTFFPKLFKTNLIQLFFPTFFQTFLAHFFPNFFRRKKYVWSFFQLFFPT